MKCPILLFHDRNWLGKLGLVYVRECSNTLYVGLAHTAPPTNTNFRLTFLLTQLFLFRSLSMKTYLYRASNFEVYHHFSGLSFIAEVNFWHPLKNIVSCDLFIIIIIVINFFRRVFSEYTEVNATSIIPLDNILPEIYAFIIGFSCTVWTKMRSLTGKFLPAHRYRLPI